jgi:hypothetical protein
MKKLLLIILIATSFTACKKQGQCYHCTFGTISGYTPPPEDYCGPLPYVKKVNGNEVNTFCSPK